MTTILRDSTPETRPAASSRRHDIQGLRALAVGLVVLFHLRPALLPGGFAGVDVFFVISGFLIIGTLTGEIRRTGRLGLRSFYARRIRRLLPAASAVLLATVVATVLLMPVSRWPSVLRDVVTSALNVQNWTLAILSTDYAQATASVSPVQHFWSLSVEEQFYLVIPLVLLASAALAARMRAQPVKGAFGAVAAITVVSLGFSVLFTPDNHGAAYFITPTRMWELGAGGLAAMLLPRIRLTARAAMALGWLGLATVLTSAVTLSTNLAFPGWIALIPTLGTLALLVAGTRPGGASALLGRQPFRYLGDISYSLYLWHWPVIVFLLEPAGSGGLDRRQALIAVAVSLVLAAASKHVIEDPFRKPAGRKRNTYLLGVAMVLTTVVAATVPWQLGQGKLDALAGSSALDINHPGALALDPDMLRPPPTGISLVPDPSIAGNDFPLEDRPGCSGYNLVRDAMSGSACSYGSPKAPKTMLLLGDSHAAMFSSALAGFVATHHDWRLKVVVHNGCPFTSAAPAEAGIELADCTDYNHQALTAVLALKPDLVITSAMSPESYATDLEWTWPSRAAVVAGYRQMLRPLAAAGIPVSVIREIPRPALPVPTCLEHHRAETTPCDTSRADAFSPGEDPLVDAVTGLAGTRVIDLTSWLCTADTCPAVIGNVVVYRDNHLTDSYVRTLSDPLAAALGLR